AMLMNDNCPILMVWGITDNASWRQPGAPLLYDSNVNRKPAWYAVRSAFRKAAKEIELSIDELPATDSSRLLRQEYYTLTGLRLQEAPQTHHPFILRNIYEDGSVKVRKVVK
ncbi:MAG: endo-1,4-beta-xylanase, partial [Bacteroidaceae bacterium]|nr:endo-1,4-beta-xylanase [Bacteroidaceae bacterium]